MYYFPKHKIGFFHIPKTGGTAFGKFMIDVMRERGDREQEITLNRWHEPLSAKRRVLGEDLFNQSVFLTTVRNPYAVVVSLYFWCMKKFKEQHADLKDYPEYAVVASMSFSEFVHWHLQNELPIEDFFVENEEVPPNLRILRLENLDAEADAILNGELALGVDVTVPVANASPHGPVMSYLENDHIRLINQHYAWSFDWLYSADRVLARDSYVPGSDTPTGNAGRSVGN